MKTGGAGSSDLKSKALSCQIATTAVNWALMLLRRCRLAFIMHDEVLSGLAETDSALVSIG